MPPTIDHVMVCVSTATDPQEAIEDAEAMWDLDAVHAIVIYQDEQGRSQVARHPKDWTNVDVSDV